MLYVVRMQSFFWNSQNIANLDFRFENAALQCVNTRGPMQCLNMSEPLLSGPNHGQENREKEEQETEVRC